MKIVGCGAVLLPLTPHSHRSEHLHRKSTKSAASLSLIQASKLQKRDFKDLSDEKVYSSQQIFQIREFRARRMKRGEVLER